MAKYLVLIYGDETVGADPAVAGEVMRGHAAFGEKHGAKLVGGEALRGSDTATTVRPDGADGFTVTDGPYAETKEALGGFYLVEAADLDEALAVARDIPMPAGGVEVRPVMVFDR